MSFTRRDFLNTSGATALGAMAGNTFAQAGAPP